MASIQRTAYPRFKRMIGARDLQEHYTPTTQEWSFVQQATRLPQLRMNCAAASCGVSEQSSADPSPSQKR